MQPDSKQVREAVEAIQARCAMQPTIGAVLGSGLGKYADGLADAVKIPYGEIPHFPTSSVPGHAGQLVIGKQGAATVVVMQGRVHFYEGYGIERVVFPMRVLAGLGIKAVLVTNAAGGVNTQFEAGDLMLIVDHINLCGQNPLIGENDDAVGPRFPDMTTAYDRELCKLASSVSAETGVSLRQGVYTWLSGPTYETPAEVGMISNLGGDATGMSTVPEVIIARHAGVRVVGISCITNRAAGLSGEPLSHDEVKDVANRVETQFIGIVSRLIERMAEVV